MQQCSEKGLEHLDRISSKNKKMPDTGLITATIVPSQKKKKKSKILHIWSKRVINPKTQKAKSLCFIFQPKRDPLSRVSILIFLSFSFFIVCSFFVKPG